MSFYIKPECAPFYYKDGVKHKRDIIDEKIKGYSHNANGYLLPCCWCDSVAFRPDFAKYGFFDPELHIGENDIVEDIIASEPWGKWLHDVCHDPQNAPRVCIQKCGQGLIPNDNLRKGWPK